MIARNDITGDALKTKGANDDYRAGWDRIFGKKEEAPQPAHVEVKPEPKIEVQKLDHDAAEDALRQGWWEYCQQNRATFTTSRGSGHLIPTFEEWRQLVGR